jgi:hypothetical protein
MNEQGDLFAQPPIVRKKPGGVIGEHARMNRQRQIEKRNARIGEPTGKLSIEQRFREFHAENPQIYRRLVTLAREMRRKREHWGIRPLIEIVRYEHAMTTDSDDGFKINNDYCSRYARLIMESEPGLDGFFETRELKAL